MGRIFKHVIDAVGVGFTAYATFGGSSADRIRARASQSPADVIRHNWMVVGQNLSSAIGLYAAKQANTAEQAHQ